MEQLVNGHRVDYLAHRYVCVLCGARLMSIMQFQTRECPGPKPAVVVPPATFSEFTEAMATAEEAYVAVIAARVEAFSRCTDILCGEVARGCAETGPCCKNCCHPPLVTPPAPTTDTETTP